MFQKTISGASLKLYINGIPFGIASSISWKTNAGRKPLYGIDSVLPFELAPGAQAVTGTITCTRLRGDGGLEGRGLSAPDHFIALEKYIDILIIDRVTGLTVLKVDKAAINTQSWQATARGLLEGNFEWEGMEWENESIHSQ